MWPVQKFVVEAVISVAILLPVFSHCNSEVAGGYIIVGDTVCQQGRIYFPGTGKCYQAGRQNGPCGERMTLVPSAQNENVGVCACRRREIRGNSFPVTGKIFKQVEPGQILDSSTKGPCRNGDWLVTGRENIRVCERIPWPESYYDQSSLTPIDVFNVESTFVVAIPDICFAPGDPYSSADPEEESYFNSIYPKTKPARAIMQATIATLRTATTHINNRCADGSFPDYYGGCDSLTLIY